MWTRDEMGVVSLVARAPPTFPPPLALVPWPWQSIEAIARDLQGGRIASQLQVVVFDIATAVVVF